MLIGRIIVWVVIGTVIACPFPCLAEAAKGHDSKVTVGRKCGCCGPVQPTEPVPRRSDQGGTCLCHGAVLEHVAQVPTLELQSVFVEWIGDAEPRMTTSSVCAVELQFSACDFASADSGRILRALIESLLL